MSALRANPDSTGTIADQQNNPNWRSIWRTAARNIDAILSGWPRTINYISKWDLLSYEDEVFRIFWKVADRHAWCIVEWDNEIRILDDVKTELENDIKKDLLHWAKLPHHIKASPEIVLALFLQWAISPEIIKKAIATDRTVILKWVSLNLGHAYKQDMTLMCRDDLPYSYATFDGNWNIINI